jgi:two-component system, NarL family, nitrate/nitrite response regulator NarL
VPTPQSCYAVEVVNKETSPAASLIKVAILEDHQGIIDGYLFRFSQSSRIRVVGTACYGDELEPLLAAHPADVVFLDVNVPASRDKPNPYPIFHVIPRLLQIYPKLSLLVISMLTERALIKAVMEAGASGYVLKDDREAIQSIESIVLAVASGGIYLSEQAQQQVFKRQPADPAEVLTPRQREVLSLCSAYPDWSGQQLAQKLNIEYSTVRNTLSNAYFRLGVRNLAAAMDKARQLGLITPLPSVTRP